MFCFQCEQVAKGTGCTKTGVCGKMPETAQAQDELTCTLIALAGAARDKISFREVDIITDGLFMTLSNVNYDEKRIGRILGEAQEAIQAHGAAPAKSGKMLFAGDADAVSLRSTLLVTVRGLAAYMYHARRLGQRSEEIDRHLVNALSAIDGERSTEQWFALVLEAGGAVLKCIEMLDKAHTTAFGKPTPATVSVAIERGPFIVISGHDMHDLSMLLDQTDGTGVSVYTHGEMLPAHGYPELKKHPQLKGHAGTGWHNQKKEFDALPAPIVFTTNCLLEPAPNYIDRVYTTAVAGVSGLPHIEADEQGKKDFSPLIQHAKKLGGYIRIAPRTGLNGGSKVTTGYGKDTLLANMNKLVDAVKAGNIKHFFVVGGCDGARASRNYYTEFVKHTPKDTIVLTLGCAKYRFNDINIGSIGALPRLLDMGQCNDAYGAIQVASALAEALKCPINELPLTMVLSWYEQKVFCVLMALLSLGIKNIYLGPSMPAFFSKNVLKMFTEEYQLRLINKPDTDMEDMLRRGARR